MNSKRKDLQYASVFLLAVALTFLMGKGDNLWLVSWGDLIPSLFVLFIAGDCLHSSLLRIKSGEENGGARWSTCFTFLVFSIVFMGKRMKNLSLIEPFTGLSSFKLYLLVYIN